MTSTNVIAMTEDVSLEVDDVILNKEMEKLWNLETLGIQGNESSWYEKCTDSFEFLKWRYQVNLSFKENRRFMEIIML